MQISVNSAISVLVLTACTFPSWKNPSGNASDAGGSNSSSEQTCADSRGVCFLAPELTTVSWGLTSITFRSSPVQSSTPTIILASNGSSEIIELKHDKSQMVEIDRLNVTPPPWQALGGDFNLDGKEDYVVACPGTASQLGVLSIWLGHQADKWSNALTQPLGLGTYAAAVRQVPVSEEVFAVGASYNAQLLLPVVAHKGASPTPGKSVALDFTPTAVEFATNAAGTTQLFAVGSTSGRGKLIAFGITGETLTQIAGYDALGTSPNDVKVADINGDSRLDAVVVDDSDQSRLYSLLGESSNLRSTTKQLDLPPHSHAVTISDFDRDGYADVATISGSTSTIQVCFGDGTGVFGECVQVPHALEQPTDLVAFDSDGDGWVEFFAIGYEGQLSRVQLGPARDK